MLVWKHRQVVQDDWQLVADDAPVPAAHALVRLPRWLAEAATDAAVAAAGVVIHADDDIDVPALKPAQQPLIAIAFAAATDGRGFSQARLLRRRGYAGELRATGAFNRDQLAFLFRCGFDAFELTVAEAADGYAASLDAISLVYQPAADNAATIRALRLARHAG